MLPFTREQFFNVFADYNAAVWPAAVIAYLLAIIAMIAIVRRWSSAPLITGLLLALMWAWTGLAYHLAFFSRINGLAALFAILFVLGAAVFGWHGIIRRRISPLAWRGWPSLPGWAMIAYSAIAYPLIGLAAGHDVWHLPHFGITPCPVTLFTLGVLLLAQKPPWSVLAAPAVWSLIGGSAAFLLEVPQDWPLLASGVFTLLVLILSRRDNPSAA